MKKLRLFLLALGLLALPLVVHATQGVMEANITLASNAEINDNYVRAGQDILIQGTVHGDVMVAGRTVTIDGNVDGDVLAAAETVTINGAVAGNVRAAARTITLTGSVGRNASLLAETINVHDDASIGWSLQSAGRSMTFNGTVTGNVHFYGATADIRGTINGNAFFGMTEDGTLRLTAPASIGKDLTYQATEQFVIPADVTVGGAVLRQEPMFRESDLRRFFTSVDTFSRVAGVFGTLVVGLILLSVMPRFSNRVVTTMRTKAKIAFGWGALLAVAVPVLAVILLVTIIGIPLAILSMLLYGMAWYVTKVYLGLFVGIWMLERFGKKFENGSRIWVMVLGVVVVSIVSMIPVIGWIACGLAAVWTFGALVLTKRESLLAEEHQSS